MALCSFAMASLPIWLTTVVQSPKQHRCHSPVLPGRLHREQTFLLMKMAFLCIARLKPWWLRLGIVHCCQTHLRDLDVPHQWMLVLTGSLWELLFAQTCAQMKSIQAVLNADGICFSKSYYICALRSPCAAFSAPCKSITCSGSLFSSSLTWVFFLPPVDLLKGRSEDLKPDHFLRKSPSLESLSKPPAMTFAGRMLSSSPSGLKPPSKLR